MPPEEADILIPVFGEVYFMAGILLAAALFFSIIYAGLNKNRSYLLFSAYSFLAALSLFFLEDNNLLIFLFIFTFSCLFLVYFFLDFFDALKTKVTAVFPLGLIVFTVSGLEFFQNKNETIFLVIAWFIFILALMACTWISLRAYNNQQYGGKLLFFTTALIFLFNLFLISDSFFISTISIASGMIVLAVTFTVLQDIQKQKELVKSLRVKAVHLENEMLKKFIQPHFLLNTLTVLSEWIEEKPSLAVRQIDLLSKEFRFINRAAGKKTIPIREELRICQVHLDIFNAKQDSNFILETKNINNAVRIPPMIFHTLIENGLTHSGSKKGRFFIEQKELKNEIHFRISAEPFSEGTGDGEGLGLAYVESRLEQAFPGKWSLTAEGNNGAWETLIVMKQ